MHVSFIPGSDVQDQLEDSVLQLFATSAAFAAIKKDGTAGLSTLKHPVNSFRWIIYDIRIYMCDMSAKKYICDII